MDIKNSNYIHHIFFFPSHFYIILWNGSYTCQSPWNVGTFVIVCCIQLLSLYSFCNLDATCGLSVEPGPRNKIEKKKKENQTFKIASGTTFAQHYVSHAMSHIIACETLYALLQQFYLCVCVSWNTNEVNVCIYAICLFDLCFSIVYVYGGQFVTYSYVEKYIISKAFFEQTRLY